MGEILKLCDLIRKIRFAIRAFLCLVVANLKDLEEEVHCDEAGCFSSGLRPGGRPGHP